MNLIYYSEYCEQKKEQILRVIEQSGKALCVIFCADEHAFKEHISEGTIYVCQEERFQDALQLIMQETSGMEQGKKLAVTQEPKEFTVESLNVLLKELYQGSSVVEIPIKGGRISQYLNDVIYFEYADRNVFMVTEDNRIKTMLKRREAEALTKASAFAMPYVSFIVNLQFVERIGSSEVILKNGDKIPLSQKKAAEFRKKFKEYLSVLS